MWASLFTAIQQSLDKKYKRRERQEEVLAEGPSWRYRRRLIHGAYVLGFGMVLFGAFTVFTTSQIGVEMIVGGVSLIAIIVTAYTTSATYEDVRLWNDTPRVRFGEGKPEEGANHESVHNYETDNPDGT